VLHHPPPSILPKYQTHHDDVKTPIVSANKENIPAVTILSNEAENTEQGMESLANTKEKTPMCLVNELARFNKIQHQYRLVSEQGPAHKKRFTVVLKLGDEEYAAEGLSIKKAQHAAAKDAILKTAYKHPPLKTNRQLKAGLVTSKNNSGNITPTVELNALAMKRGEPTVYNVTSTTAPAMLGMPPNAPPPQQFNPRGPNPYQQRRFPNQRGAGNFQNGRFSGHYGTETFHVTLHVGNRTFSGMGPTQQAARHDAAAR
jgi:double-stranded RNA-binding protein Staufen